MHRSRAARRLPLLPQPDLGGHAGGRLHRHDQRADGARQPAAAHAALRRRLALRARVGDRGRRAPPAARAAPGLHGRDARARARQGPRAQLQPPLVPQGRRRLEVRRPGARDPLERVRLRRRVCGWAGRVRGAGDGGGGGGEEGGGGGDPGYEECRCCLKAVGRGAGRGRVVGLLDGDGLLIGRFWREALHDSSSYGASNCRERENCNRETLCSNLVTSATLSPQEVAIRDHVVGSIRRPGQPTGE